MKDDTYYLKKYLLLMDEIKNKSQELRQSFNDDMNISLVVRSTAGIYDSIVEKIHNQEIV